MVIYVVSLLYTQYLRYNICSAWFLDIRISTCFTTFHNPCCIQQEVDITEDMTRTYLLGYSIA